MAFRNFIYAENEEDLSFPPKEHSLAFGTGSPSVSINIEPLMTNEELVLQPTEAMVDSEGSPKCELFVVHPGSLAARMKNRKCKTRRGSSRPLVKRKLAPRSSTAYATHAKTSASKDDVCFLTISNEDEGLSDVPKRKDAIVCHLKILNITHPSCKNHLDNYIDFELLDLPDRCYARQSFVDNVMNRRSCELLGVIEKLRGECDMIKERERARKEEFEGYQANLSSLESQVVSLEAKKARLKAVEVSLRKKVDDARRDRMEVFLKIVPYAAMELIHSDDLGSLVGKLVTSAIVYGRYPSAHVEVLLKKKPPSIQKPSPSKTKALVASFQKATPSFVLASNTMSPPADTSVVRPSSFQTVKVIEFGDSYKVPATIDPNSTTTTRKDDEKSGRTVTITTEDMHRKKNDVKARTTLLLSLPDEHQLRFSKYKTANELWAVILKTFGGNEATKKRKKNLLKQQYGNFKAEGAKTLEQTNDLDTMSLDDLYNHLKVYEAEVQKKSNLNSQNMAFISSLKRNSGDEDGNTACVSTASTTVPTASASVATISQDTASAYIASQSSGSQIKFKDINQIDEDDMEEIDIKWSMALLSMGADKVPRSQERGRKDNYRQGSKAKEKTPKALMTIDGVGWNWSYMANEGEDHALVADSEAHTEFALMANTESKVFDNSLCSNDCKKNNDSLNSLLKASKNIDNLIESQRSDKVKEGVRYNAVPPAAADLYLSPKKDLSWTGLPEFVDDTVTDYSRPMPTVESTSEEGQNKHSSTSKDVASPITPKLFVKFVKPKDTQSEKNKKETPKKSQVKYVKQYRHSIKKSNMRGNQRNWNNLKSYQL
nr:hypothetical protein [Tanacetum cinerariifolium]